MSRRAATRYVLIEHQRKDNGGGCHCGWGERPEHLGLSWAEHICDELAAVGVVEARR